MEQKKSQAFVQCQLRSGSYLWMGYSTPSTGYSKVMIGFLYGKHKETKGMKYGNLHEAEAPNNYHQKLLIPHPLSLVNKTGAHIDTKDRWLSALPDGRVNLGDDSSG